MTQAWRSKIKKEPSAKQDWKKKKRENKEQGKTQRETPLSENHKVPQNKNYPRTTALER